jgi:deazaflavin-dependent oxidoreductase (nitroreductase family)
MTEQAMMEPTMTNPTGPGPAGSPDHSRRYLHPGRGTVHIFNRAVAFLTRHGISVYGSRVLYVRGRTTGEWRSTPVNPLTLDGDRYLVAPRGHTQWVRNMRVAGGGELRIGRRAEAFTATEVADADKPAILRAYLRKWKFEVGTFFDGTGPDASDEQLLAIAPGYPVFRVTPQPR